MEKNIIGELKEEKKVIEDKNISITSYNHGYIKDHVYQGYGQRVFLPAIIKLSEQQKKTSINQDVRRGNFTTERF